MITFKQVLKLIGTKKVKSTLACPVCNSENVQLKAWVRPNTQEIMDYLEDGSKGWCQDCFKNRYLCDSNDNYPIK